MKLVDGSNMSQVYFGDGQALGPENFGYTDPLTNTWRPKKQNANLNGWSNMEFLGTTSGQVTLIPGGHLFEWSRRI